LVRDDDGRLGEHLVGAADRRADPERERDRVAGTRRHPNPLADHQLGVEDVVAHLDDLDRPQRRFQRRQHIPEQVVGGWRSRFDPLLLVRDGGRLYRTDPDRQVTVALHLFEQHDRLVGWQLHPNTDHAQLTHRRLRVASSLLPARYTAYLTNGPHDTTDT